MNHKLFTSLIEQENSSVNNGNGFIDELGKSFLLMRDKPKVILICGMNKDDGSTSIACWLSLAISKYSESKITLIDANLKSPSIHEFMDVENKSGFFEVISSGLNVEDLLISVENTRLSILTAGQGTSCSQKLLSQNMFKRLIDPLRKDSDYIIIDGLPLLSNVTDSFLLARMIENIIIVVRSGSCRWEILENTKENLMSFDINILGVILNCAEQPIPGFIYRHM